MCVCVCVALCVCVCVLVMALRVALCGLYLTPPVMCEHARGWHQATPMFSSPRREAAVLGETE